MDPFRETPAPTFCFWISNPTAGSLLSFRVVVLRPLGSSLMLRWMCRIMLIHYLTGHSHVMRTTSQLKNRVSNLVPMLGQGHEFVHSTVVMLCVGCLSGEDAFRLFSYEELAIPKRKNDPLSRKLTYSGVLSHIYVRRFVKIVANTTCL